MSTWHFEQSNQQLDEWKRHILNEHQPARRDCAECLRAMGRSRPHHRNAHASAYSLNIDVAGPYPGGHDQAGVAPRYFMVGVYTLPVKDGAVWWSHFKILADIDMKKARTNTGEHPGYRIKKRALFTRELLQLEVLVKMMKDYNRKFTTVIGLSQKQGQGQDFGRLWITSWLGCLCGRPSKGRWTTLWGDDPWAGYQEQAVGRACEWPVGRSNPEPHDGSSSEKPSCCWDHQGPQLFLCKAEDNLPLHRVHSDRAKESVSKPFATWIFSTRTWCTRQRQVMNIRAVQGQRVRLDIWKTVFASFSLPQTRGSTSGLWPFDMRPIVASDPSFDRLVSPSHRFCPLGFRQWAGSSGGIRTSFNIPCRRWPSTDQHMTCPLSSGGYYVNCDGHWMRTTVVVVPRFSQHVCGNTPELELPPPEAPELEYAPTTPGEEEIPVDLVLTGGWSWTTWWGSNSGASRWTPTSVASTSWQANRSWSTSTSYSSVDRKANRSTSTGCLADRGGVLWEDDAVWKSTRWTRSSWWSFYRLDEVLSWWRSTRWTRSSWWSSTGWTRSSWWRSTGWTRSSRWRSTSWTRSPRWRSTSWTRSLWCGIKETMAEAKTRWCGNAMMRQHWHCYSWRIWGNGSKKNVPWWALPRDAEMIMEVHKQCEQIEGHLCALQHEEEGDGKNNNEEETLVAKTIPIEEVRKELPKWKDAMVSEYDSLIQHGAIEPIDERQYEELKRTKESISTIPGMMVSVLKPPQRRKARFVACGNYMGGQHEKQDVSAGGLDCIVVRSMLSLATKMRWSPRRENGKSVHHHQPAQHSQGSGNLAFWWERALAGSQGALRPGWEP